MVKIIPTTKIAKTAVILIIAMPILFFLGGLFSRTLYSSVPAGETILGDISARPILAISMLVGILSGITAFSLGLYSVLKKKEQGILVYLPILIGGMLLFMLVGEFIFPH